MNTKGVKIYKLFIVFTLAMWLGIGTYSNKIGDNDMAISYPPLPSPTPIKLSPLTSRHSDWGVLDLATGTYVNDNPLSLREAIRLQERECPETHTYRYVVQPWIVDDDGTNLSN